MNRLIILGNGFDLAHGLKTSFNDFIADYLYNCVQGCFGTMSYSDPLVEMSISNMDRWNFVGPMSPQVDPKNIFDFLERYGDIFNFKIHSKLLDRLYNKCCKLLWVDVELEYFDILLTSNLENDPARQREAIERVNRDLDYLKGKLIDYLSGQEQSLSDYFNLEPLVNCFCSPIEDFEVVTVKMNRPEIPEALFFLNFNYTKTFEAYYEMCKPRIRSDFNYIHGSLSGAHGNPIFGFGDEFDKKYLKFEDEKNNELFRHIKSFEYLQTKNFYQLTRYLESDLFQVHIYGHSCGLSDRTMLNQIFEHENCKSVKIYYHQKENSNDFTEKTYEISRHFKDKTMLRKKLVPFPHCSDMPQPIAKY